MRRILYLLALLSTVLIAGCTSESGKIHDKVEAILDDIIADGYTYDIVKYENWDSTYYVKSDNVAANKAYANEVPYFKKGISYEPFAEGDKLIYVSVKYKIKQTDSSDTTTINCQQTFYMDKELKGIVCVKEN